MHLLPVSGRVRFELTGSSRATSVAIPAVRLSLLVRSGGARRVGPVDSAPICTVLFSTLDGVFERPSGASPSFALAIQALAISAIEQIAANANAQFESSLRSRIVAHVEQHLRDPALTSRSIATDFGISVRLVHQTFAGSGVILAKLIRERRLDIAKESLVVDSGIARANHLAEIVGFGAADSLARAFKARYGSSIADFEAKTTPTPLDSDS